MVYHHREKVRGEEGKKEKGGVIEGGKHYSRANETLFRIGKEEKKGKREMREMRGQQ